VKISIFGLGYVGAVTAGCLAEQGHQIIGVDVHEQKVAELNRGEAPVLEPGLDALIWQAHGKGLLRATLDAAEAVAQSDVSLVCVGTPSDHNGALDLSSVQQVTSQIAAALRARPKPHALVYRSTMLPGSTERLVAQFLTDLQADGQLTVVYYPEFLREGSALADFRDPSLVVVGTADGQPVAPNLAPLFGPQAQVVNWRTAELLKYACNAFHATKVAFANEIGRLAKRLDVDAQLVMRLLCQDTRLNLSSYYLRPGNPFGGSCLPKDVAALSQLARESALRLPVLENLLPSNREHLASLLHLITQRASKEVVILGLCFKADTDDLRDSPMVEVAQYLLGRGYTVRIYDPQLNLNRVVGRNKRVIDERLPHLASLLHTDLGSALGQGGLVLAAQKCVAITELARYLTPQHTLLDINGWPELKRLAVRLAVRYEGFCW
jgi:GDP-mannose 6-dehydrogenase